MPTKAVTSASARAARARAANVLTLKELLSYRVHRVANAMSRGAALRFRREYDVSIGEWRAIALLKIDAPLSLNKLARASGLDKAQMSRVISALVRRRLVVRETGGAQRAVRLTLTRQGMAAYRRLFRAAMERNTAFTGCLTAHERAVFERCLSKLFAVAQGFAHAELDRLAAQTKRDASARPPQRRKAAGITRMQKRRA